MIARLDVVRRVAGMGVAAALLLAPPAHAEGGAHIATEPAATLLLPYFEVSLPKKPGAKPKGTNTVFTIFNSSATAVLAHVNIWSDLGVPVSFFDVYLTGYDVVIVDLAEVLSGRLPRTASDGQDPTDEISPQGDISQDINFASCTGQLPQADLPPESVEHLRASLTGKPSPLFGGQCFGRDYGEKKPIARGYITIDTVNSCSQLFASSPGYFVATVTDQNLLFGDYFITDNKGVYGDALVHIRADALEFVPGDYTFYAREVDAVASDHRQPLATNYAGRFANDKKDPLFPRGTEAIVWRDVKQLSHSPFNCASTPAFFPLSQEQIVVFDEEENAEVPLLPAIPPLPAETILPFQGATQKVRLGTEEFPISFPRGWVYLNLNSVVVGQSAGLSDPAAAQAFVTMVHGTKRHPIAVRATALDDANDASHVILPVP
jgi:hypothetical protein